MSSEEKNSSPASEATPSFMDSKIFRLFTLALYLGGIGGMGFILSIYYLFIWNSEMPQIPEFKGKKLI